METYLRFAVENNASDCFISAGKPVAFRVLGEVVFAQNNPVEAEAIRNFRLKVLGVRGNEKYRDSESADTSYCTEDGLRFRLNFFETLAGPALVARPVRSGSDLSFSSLS